MVLAYHCPVHGIHNECDVDESGERICPEGGDTAVTGITGSARTAPPGESGFGGEVDWTVTLDWGGESVCVSAFDYEEAFEKALNATSRDDPAVTEIKPTHRQHRGSPV